MGGRRSSCCLSRSSGSCSCCPSRPSFGFAMIMKRKQPGFTIGFTSYPMSFLSLCLQSLITPTSRLSLIP